MKTIEVLNLKVFDYGGNNPPLIFLHSFPLNSLMWDKQVSFFKDKYRVFTYDIRGFGQSDNGDYIISMEKLVNDFFHIINKLKLKKVNACGLSMGGYILLRAVIKNYERFSSLILLNTNPYKDNDEVILKRTSSIIKIKSGGRNTFIQKLLPQLSQKLSVQSEIKNIIDHNSDDGICAGLIAMSTRTDTIKNLNFYDIPVLMLESENDNINKLNLSNLYYDLLKNPHKFENSLIKLTLKSSGHIANLDNYADFNEYLNWFLQSYANT